MRLFAAKESGLCVLRAIAGEWFEDFSLSHRSQPRKEGIELFRVFRVFRGQTGSKCASMSVHSRLKESLLLTNRDQPKKDGSN